MVFIYIGRMSRLPPLVELRAFEAAARHLSFKAAAAELGVTPTAISHQIRLLERYCGRALFRRRPRPMTLTEAGVRLFPGVRDGLQAFATAITTVKRDRETQPLRITTTNAFASRWLVPRLAGWKKARPGIPLEVIGTDAVLDLYAGDADVAIRYAPTAPRDGNVIKLFTDTFWPVCSPQFMADGRLKRAGDLRKRVLIHCWWSPSDREAPTWERWLTVARSKWRDVPKFDEMTHLSFREELHGIEAIIAGEGIGICSDALISSELKNGVLVKAFEVKLPGRSYYLVSPAVHAREKAVKAFAAWLQSVV
jgi:LysR family glycine cleavage system transcriptional activator